MLWLTIGEKILLLKGRVASNQTAIKDFQTNEDWLKGVLKENCFKSKE